MFETNQMKDLRKIVNRTERDTRRIRNQQIRESDNPAVSNQLMRGWKEEEENGNNM